MEESRSKIEIESIEEAKSLAALWKARYEKLEGKYDDAQLDWKQLFNDSEKRVSDMASSLLKVSDTLSDLHSEDGSCVFSGSKDVGCIACLAQFEIQEALGLERKMIEHMKGARQLSSI